MTSHKAERQWWIAALVLIVLIYGTLYFVRGPIEFLRERNLLRLAVGLLFLASGSGVAVYLWKRRTGARELAVLLGFATVFGAAVSLAGLPEEKLHFLEYGLLGALLFHAFRERATRIGGTKWAAALLAGLAAALAGWGDEGIQALLPNRYYDVRDIVWNVLGSSLVILALFCAEAARRGGGVSPADR